LLGFIEIDISDHKLSEHYFNMLAELNKYGFRRSAYLRQGWTEAHRRRQGCQSVVSKAEDTRSQQGTAL